MKSPYLLMVERHTEGTAWVRAVIGWHKARPARMLLERVYYGTLLDRSGLWLLFSRQVTPVRGDQRSFNVSGQTSAARLMICQAPEDA